MAPNDLHCAWVGIGSNLGDPVEQVLSGIADLDAIPHTRC
jgi:7,8-dihydro-6-hydroxymethylpterin-pyrophosphokinase